jgi:geranylgeranyl reductase family protein
VSAEAEGPTRTEEMLDVAVIGAGPAGSWTAYCLAKAGARVAIVDGSHPREKPCGGGLTARAMAVVRPYFGEAYFDEVAIRTARFEAGGREASVGLTSEMLSVVSRRTFDGALLDAAVSAGAEHVPARVTDVAPDGGGWTIAAGRGCIRSSWLIGADGPNSLVRRRVARPFPRGELSIAAGYFVHGHTSREIDLRFIDEPAGYLWSFPRRDHLAVGACAQADESSSSEMLAHSARWIDARFQPEPGALQRYSWPVPSLSVAAIDAEQPAGARWMLVGDAAGLVDPITREGIYFALRSAACAAVALGGSNPQEYCTMIRDEIHAELSRAAALKRRFFGPRFTRLLIRALQRSPRVRLVMADLVAGEQTYGGLRRRLLATREWRLLLDAIIGDSGIGN